MRPADHNQAFEAACQWIAEHGRYPQQQEWDYKAPGRPITRTIKRRCGWEQLMREAAGNSRLGPKGHTRKAYRLELLRTLRRAREELGGWPTGGELGVGHQLACLSSLLRMADDEDRRVTG